MTAKARVLCIWILLVIFSGCAQKPVFTVEVYASPTATAVATDPLKVIPTLASINTPIIAPVPSPTPVEPVFMSPDFSPILYGKKYNANMFFLLLGGVRGNTWLTPEQAAPQFNGQWEYDVHTPAQGYFKVLGYAPEFSPPYQSYFIGTDSSANEFGMVGVLHGWPVRQGTVQELVADNQAYKQVVLDWLKSQGVSTNEPGTLQIFRVDLEADGVDEIFISATHLDGSQHTTKTGDHSIVLMRKVIGNEALTIPLVSDIYRSQQAESTFPATYSLGNFIDLNRDGILEVIVDIQRWEGFGAKVYRVDSQNVVEVLR